MSAVTSGYLDVISAEIEKKYINIYLKRESRQETELVFSLFTLLKLIPPVITIAFSLLESSAFSFRSCNFSYISFLDHHALFRICTTLAFV